MASPHPLPPSSAAQRTRGVVVPGRARPGGTGVRSRVVGGTALQGGSLKQQPHRRPPILLEIISSAASAKSGGCHLEIRVGYVGQPQPMQVVAMASTASYPEPKNTSWPPDRYYRLYSPIVQQAINALMVPNLNDLSDRHVVVVYDWADTGIVLPDNAKEALLRLLLEEHQFQAAAFTPAVEMVPFAFPPNTIREMIVVQLSLDSSCGMAGIHCMAFASHEPLEYTYQSSLTASSRDGNRRHLLSKDDPFLNDDPDESDGDAVVDTILKCLEACPREIRKGAVANLVVAGSAACSEGISVKIARQVRATLRGQRRGRDDTGRRTEEQTVLEEAQSENVSPQQQAAVHLTRVPVRIAELSCLAESVGVVEITTIRPDLMSWVGASLWGSHLHSVNPDSPSFQWIQRRKE